MRFAESAVLAPLGPVKLAADVAGGKEFNQALYEAVRNYIDAPLYIADPTIFAFDDALPPPLGGGVNDDPATSHGSLITDFRNNVLWKATSDTRTPIRDALVAEDPVSGSNARGAITALGAGEDAAPVQEIKGRSLVKTSVLGANDKKVGAHRRQTDDPVRATVKRLRESVKSASAPRHTRTGWPAA